MGEMRSFPGGKDPRHLVYYIFFGMIQVEERLESGGSMDRLSLMRKRAPLFAANSFSRLVGLVARMFGARYHFLVGVSSHYHTTCAGS
jgi:hypothetical protein